MHKLPEIPRLRRNRDGADILIVAAPDSFKGCLSAPEVCDAIADGVHDILPGARVLKIPLSDGGWGLASSLLAGRDAGWKETSVHDPLMRPMTAGYALMPGGKTAIVEMAAASGLALLDSDERNPILTTTFGTGELIKAALDAGAGRIIVGLGGSATNDGGTGAAQALGIRFLDKNGRLLPPGLSGGRLREIAAIAIETRDRRLDDSSFMAPCDVNNPLIGPEGAARVFSPQKGAGPEDAERLEEGLEHLAEVIYGEMGIDVRTLAGGGAAGGLGAGLHAFCGARLTPGADWFLGMAGFVSRIEGADLILTGEGRLDAQTAMGKTVSAVCRAASVKKIPVIALAGILDGDQEELREIGLSAAVCVNESEISRDAAMRRANAAIRERTAWIISELSGIEER